LVVIRFLCLRAQAIEFIEVDVDLLAIERVCVAVAYEGVADQLPRFACC
jgi:hypothetical protein